MTPREPADDLQGWVCEDQLSIDDVSTEDDQEDARDTD